ncbi:AP-2 complex subunit mu [Seminavis robusta]|uniref:AP-2 complex subunit mu n=1 Tax=Seminavis robusta TaxID=568900 RepID=A0A9N8HPB5_9STRA|nr:AP-2 complex subunit mu [Seminavis robusta]|eukprot:Sro1310_g261600.1 AP-2 complex subunit mu (426) ;mRNA; f:6506-8128
MISMIMVLNQKGDIMISRQYRDDVGRAAADSFRLQVVAAKETGTEAPVKRIENCSFLYTRHLNMYFVALTRSNVNPALVFEYLFQLIRILKAYLGEDFDENAMRNNMTLIYELMDETMDFGYPQNCAVDVLRLYINLGNVRPQDEPEPSQLTSQITGAIDWRREGIRHKKNEVYIDVLESVNLLLSSNGNVLRNEVTGQVQMNTKLTGMPECKFGLNDKLVIDKEKEDRKPGVEIDDCTFHRCVRLGKFDADRTITFIPPDGEFELMRYRVTDNINLPFRIIPAVQEEQGMTKVSINLKVIANFSDQLYATHVVLKVPVPKNTAKAKIKHSFGRAKYEPEQQAIVWRVKRFAGKAECHINAEVDLMPTVRPKPWSRPPINVEFQVPMFTASGVHVRFLRVYDKSGYHTNRWVRYITKAGNYQIRI